MPAAEVGSVMVVFALVVSVKIVPFVSEGLKDDPVPSALTVSV